MIVQAGDDGVPARVEHRLARDGGETFRHVDDSLLGTDVDHRAVQQACTLNQHGANLRSATIRSIRALSAPSSAADESTTGGVGGSAAQSLSLGARGNAA